MNTPAISTIPQNAVQSVTGDLTGTTIKRTTANSARQRRTSWKGKSLPQYPDDGKRYRRPTATQIANALATPRPEHWVNIWLHRLAILDPSRYSALRAAYADKGRAGLHATHYVSVKPCKQCGGTERYAVQNQCTSCNKEVRYGKPTKATEAELMQREQKAQARASAENSSIELAGFPGGWVFKVEGSRVEILHPQKTGGKPQLLDSGRIGQHMLDAQFRSLYQWACHNRAVPDGAQYQAL